MKAIRVCSVKDCDRGHYAHGVCNLHYQRMQKSGNLPPRKTVAERLTAGLVRMPNGCLEWTRGTNKAGYGLVTNPDGTALAHRVVWILANGPIPNGLNVLHHCDNPPCCQTEPTEGYPEGHLFVGTRADNNADRDSKGRCRAGIVNAAKTHCPADHEFTEDNTYVHQGGRHCRICRRDANTRSVNKRKVA